MAISLYPADWPFAIFKVLTGEHHIGRDVPKILGILSQGIGLPVLTTVER